jgi:hypothetical protein
VVVGLGLAIVVAVAVADDDGVGVVAALAAGLDGMQAVSRIGKRATARWRLPGRWCLFTSRRRY